MLAHILALTVGLLSFALYMSAFFFPEAYRKSDLTWSGIGLFYALVLWVCAGRITGGVLLGQTASVALLGWLGWQTINLRRELAPIALRTPLPNEAKTIAQAAQFKLGELKSRWQQTKLAEQTDRLAGTIAGWTSSIAKPKQPPSVGSRSRQSKKPARSIAPATVSEPIASEPSVAESAIDAARIDAGIGEPAIAEAAAVKLSVSPVRPTRSPGLFGGLRRNAPKAKTPTAKLPTAKVPERPTPPPEPALDLEEFENWEDEDTIEAAIVSEAAIEAEQVEPQAEMIEDVVVVIEPEAAIEAVIVVVESEETIENRAESQPAIEDVVVVVEMDDSPASEMSASEAIEMEAIEDIASPADDAVEPAINPADAAFEGDRSADSFAAGEAAIAPESPTAPETTASESDQAQS